ncbi:DNA damage-binding protein CMR1-like [Telopea speciosissima]|uniref:DNA damage-binding protein CMR1-like n=1 Tax=Telopea speciosissima TaxID=54955 RepID=UPI001CC8018A|nr:DNA damage-binding protein CMR1-like [Telopea speciosissima]
MALETLTGYERQRLENIKRNGEMLASLKLHCTAQELSSVTKRIRVEAKGYKVTQSKKPKPEAPVVLRRSLRTQGMPSDSSSAGGVEDDLVVSSDKNPRLPTPKVLGPLSMKDAYSGDSSDRQLIDTILNMRENTPLICASKENFSIKGDRNSLGVITGPSENDPSSCSIEECFCSIKKDFAGDRSSDDPIFLERTLLKREAEGDMEKTLLNDSMKTELDNNGPSYSTFMSISEKAPLSSLNFASLRSKPDNTARVMPGRITNVCFFPASYRLLVIAGNEFGNIGFWDVDSQEEEGDGICLYHPHSAPVSGILIQPFSLSKVFTSSQDGLIRLLDVEKESFDLVFSSEYSIFSLSQRPHDVKSIYFGEGEGGLNVWDERAGKSSSSWMLHEQRINSIDFNPENDNLMATSSTDGTVCIWDARSINTEKPKSLKIVHHKKAVYSAYFSPSGNCLATTSLGDKVGVLRGVDFAEVDMIQHNNLTGRGICSIRYDFPLLRR